MINTDVPKKSLSRRFPAEVFILLRLGELEGGNEAMQMHYSR